MGCFVLVLVWVGCGSSLGFFLLFTGTVFGLIGCVLLACGCLLLAGWLCLTCVLRVGVLLEVGGRLLIVWLL